MKAMEQNKSFNKNEAVTYRDARGGNTLARREQQRRNAEFDARN